jgi:hypothetical protein
MVSRVLWVCKEQRVLQVPSESVIREFKVSRDLLVAGVGVVVIKDSKDSKATRV